MSNALGGAREGVGGTVGGEGGEVDVFVDGGGVFACHGRWLLCSVWVSGLVYSLSMGS